MHRIDDGIGLKDAVVKDVPGGKAMAERKVSRIPRAEELQRHLHQLFAGQFAAGEVVEDFLAVFRVQGLAFGDSDSVVAFDFEPPVRF